MTSGIRTNWMLALQKCVDSVPQGSAPHRPPTYSVHSSVPDRGISHPAYKQHSVSSQDIDTLAQSYPAVRLRAMKSDGVRSLQENRHSLDLSSIGAAHSSSSLSSKDLTVINRHVAVDDYGLSRRFDSDDSVERGSHDSMELGSPESVQSSGQSEGSVHSRGKRRRRRDKQHKSTWPYNTEQSSNLQSQDSGKFISVSLI